MKNLRRKGVIERLQNQLVTNQKPLKVDSKTTDSMIELTKNDISRIKKDIKILKQRIND